MPDPIEEINKEKMADEFVLRNPNPILRAGKDGTVLYANKAAAPLLESWEIRKGEKLPHSLRCRIGRVLAQGKEEILEIKAGERVYSMLLHPFPEEIYVGIQGFDISLRVLAENKSKSRENQYFSLSGLCRTSITCKDFQEILEKSSQLIAQGLGTDFSTIAELLPDRNFITRAGYGWEESLLGDVVVNGKEESQAGYTLFSKKPVILRNAKTETRFKCPKIFKNHGVVSGITVLIGHKDKPFGVIGVFSKAQREFTVDDIYFLESAAFLLFEIIERLRAEEKLEIQQEIERLLERRTLEYKKAHEELESEGTKGEKIEKTLLSNLKFLETLLNTISAPVFYKDSEGRFLGCNDTFARQVLGLQKEKVVGRTLPEVYRIPNSEFPLEIHKNDLEFLLKGGSDSYETEIICADGIKRVFLANRATFSDEEEKTRKMVTVLIDVTELRRTENKFQNYVRFLETLLDNIPSPIFQRDLTGTYVNCNESFAVQIMGLHKEKVIGGTFAEFEKRVPKELAEIYKRDDKKLIQNGGTQYYETKVTCADNIQRDFLFHKATYKNSSGEIAGVVGVMLDITQLKKAEKSFREGEERYRIAAEQTGQIVYDYNEITDKIEWAGAVKEITGYSLEEFKNFNLKNWEVHRHFEDRKTVLEKLKLYRQKGERFKIEYRFRKKDGSYFYVEDSGTFLKDEYGKSCRVIGVMKDITEMKFASEKLRRSEERYRSFMKNFRGIVFQQSLESIPSFVDGSVEEITGYTGEDFVSGKVDWCKIVFIKDNEVFLENRQKLLNDPLCFIEQEYRIKHRNGRIKWVREVIQNVSDTKGKRRILQGAIYDITKQKEAEESLEKVEEIRKKEIHHRIKNNLQVISSLLELQAERFNEKEVLEAFHESKNRVASMAIIHEELYKSKNNETLDFSEYLKKLTAALFHSYTVREGDVKMYLDIEETFFGMDTAIPLGIIINELISNSLKHAFPPDRKGEIRIKLCRMEGIKENENISNNIDIIDSKIPAKKGVLYKLLVSDNGLGFPEDIDFKNTSSLGLQLVNILVEQLEGTIELEKGEETVFKIFFKENS